MPDIPQPEAVRRLDLGLTLRSLPLRLLLLLALAAVLHWAREILIPTFAAIVLMFVLQPVMRRLSRLRIPEAASAAVLVLGLVASLALTLYYLSGPALAWIERAPQITREIEYKIDVLTRSVEQVRRASEQVEKAATGGNGAAPRTEVVVRQPSLLERVWQQFSYILFELATVVTLLYFLLASGSMFRAKLVRVLPSLHDKKRALGILGDIEKQVSAYLFTITVINISLGLVIGAEMWLLGLPNPVLWGAAAALLNYVPFVGPAIGAGLVGVVGFLSLDAPYAGLFAALAYVLTCTVEDNFLTPALLGRSLTLNPVVIILSILAWGWLWGIAGVLLSAPLLIVIKVFCDRVESLRTIGEFLGDDPRQRMLQAPKPPV